MRKTPSHHRISDRSPWDEPLIPPATAVVGRHRRTVERVWLPTRETLSRAAKSRPALATSALTCLALAALAGQVGTAADPASTAVAASVASASGLDQVLDTLDRGPARGSAADGTSVLDSAVSDAQSREAEAEQGEISAAEALAAPPAPPVPVAGLDQAQMNNAQKIVQTGQAMGLSKRAYVIAVATAMQESQLLNLASTRIPESYQYNAEGDGSDHDSVGLFQQRPSAGWGLVSQLMDPNYSATAFYSALLRVPGWEGMELTWAAQTVQVSAYPYAYAKHEVRAQEIVDALVATPAP
jgi:hypothetical protein